MVNGDLKVSVVIVSMNNIDNLNRCLPTIKHFTSISYEVFVVAYLFSKENLEYLYTTYPWVNIIESNEIRGFSENNNLALRRVKGEYCFVLNDDTELFDPAIDNLFRTFSNLDDKAAIVSPVTLFANGEVQFCGRPKKNIKRFILTHFHLWDENVGPHVNQLGIFKSYNILGAAFMIRTKLFEEMGWFDEFYFFCPEDIALSTKLNNAGFSCYVNADVKITHYEGMSSKSLSLIQTATKPAAMIGSIHFYSNDSIIRNIFLRVFLIFIFPMKYIYHTYLGIIKRNKKQYKILAKGDLNCFCSCFYSLSPKETFIKYYQKIIK